MKKVVSKKKLVSKKVQSRDERVARAYDAAIRKAFVRFEDTLKMLGSSSQHTK